MLLTSFNFCVFYNMINAWSLYYLFASFTSELPWSHCRNDFNTERKNDNDVMRAGIGLTIQNMTHIAPYETLHVATCTYMYMTVFLLLDRGPVVIDGVYILCVNKHKRRSDIEQKSRVMRNLTSLVTTAK